MKLYFTSVVRYKNKIHFFHFMGRVCSDLILILSFFYSFYLFIIFFLIDFIMSKRKRLIVLCCVALCSQYFYAQTQLGIEDLFHLADENSQVYGRIKQVKKWLMRR